MPRVNEFSPIELVRMFIDVREAVRLGRGVSDRP